MFNGSQKETLESLWSQAGCDPIGLDNVQIDGSDPILPSIFRVGEAAGATIAAVGAAAAELWRRRSGETQTVNVDLRAAPTAFRSERYLKIAGQSPASPWVQYLATTPQLTGVSYSFTQTSRTIKMGS